MDIALLASRISRLLPLAFVVTGIMTLGAGAPRLHTAQFASRPSVPNLSVYGKLPLSFVPNAGQANAAVRYQAHGVAGELFFGDDTVALSVPVNDQESRDQAGSATSGSQSAIVQLYLDNTDAAHRVIAGEPLPGTVSYYFGNDPARWQTNLPTYAGILYEQLYPGIDLRYDGAQRTLKGTYLVAPQADPARIRWHYSGVQGVHVDEESGDLLIAVSDGATLIERAPEAWQVTDGRRSEVDVEYVLLEDGEIGFRLGSYDAGAPLTIDPVLVYATFVGGGGYDEVKGVTVDKSGKMYLTGRTLSSDLGTSGDVTLGSAFPGWASLHGSSDAFVTEINSAGDLDFAFYLGGSGDEDAFGRRRCGAIATDAYYGFIYVAGCTTSTDFPVFRAAQPVHGGTSNPDAFVVKVLPGHGLIALGYSTYWGGPNPDTASGIAVDATGAAYIVGATNWDFLPDSSGPYITKFGPMGSLEATKAWGRHDLDWATDVAVDGAGNAYIVGTTYSTDLPVLHAAQATIGGGSGTHSDAFVAKVNLGGTGPVYMTYLGGSGGDEGYGIAVDEAGSAYVTGETQSTDFPTHAPFQAAYGGGRSDAFVAKLSPTGEALEYSTYLGGGGDEDYSNEEGGIAYAGSGSVVVTGQTCSTTFPLAGSMLTPVAGNCYAFITRLASAGNQVLYSTLYGGKAGGSENTSGVDIAADADGNAYVVGHTNAPNLLTAHPLQPSYAGMVDGFIAKIAARAYLYLPLLVR